MDKVKEKKHNTIFISYSHNDFNKAKDLAESCRNWGFNTWLDEFELRPGENWQEESEKAIKTCKLALVLISKSAISSNSVNKEWSLLCEEKWNRPDIYIVPIILENTKMPAFLCEYQSYLAEKNTYEKLKVFLEKYLEGEVKSNKKQKDDEEIKTEVERLTERVRDLKQSLKDVRESQEGQKNDET